MKSAASSFGEIVFRSEALRHILEPVETVASTDSTVLIYGETGSGKELFLCIFVPLSGVSLGTLPQEENGNASGIFNLVRNLGGSIGIAAANTVTERHLQTHRNDLAHSLTGAHTELR